MVQIQPTDCGFPKQTATQILIRPIISSTTDKSCNTYWEICNSEGKQIADGNTPLNEQEYS